MADEGLDPKRLHRVHELLARFLTSAVFCAASPMGLAQKCPHEDAFEDNDTCETALPFNFPSLQGLAAFNGDPDYFVVDVPDATQVTVTIDYEPLQAPLDLHLIGLCRSGSFSGSSIDSSETGSGVEVTSWVNVTGAQQPVVVLISVPLGLWAPCNWYDLTVDLTPVPVTPLGTTYCDSSPNSSGASGVLRAHGTNSVLANDLEFVGSGLPGITTVLLFDGTAPVMEVFFDGFRCVGGSVFRLGVGFSDGAGQSRIPLDLANPPQPAGQILAGSTWYFQLWYRDQLGSVGFNLTDGLEVAFGP